MIKWPFSPFAYDIISHLPWNFPAALSSFLLDVAESASFDPFSPSHLVVGQADSPHVDFHIRPSSQQGAASLAC
jgi:hypothetical protein